MSLDAALSIASSGLANVNQQFRLVSQNVANAQTPDYAREVSTPLSVAAGGQGMGAQSGMVQRVLDQQLQAALFTQNASVAGWQTQQTALQKIDAVQGTPGQGGDLAGLLGQLQDGFSALVTDPSSTARQAAVVSAAGNLAGQLNALSNAVTNGRQQAQHDLVGQVATLNTTLASIGDLNRQIVALRGQGQNTTDLENQRDAARDSLSKLISVRALEQPNGDLLLMTPSGLRLPTSGGTPFATSDANPGPTAYYPAGGLPGITLGGQDVTASLQGGSIGANVALRDSVLPGFQAGLDEFAQTISTRMDAQGLRLFTDAAGNVPASTGPNPQSGYVGYAASIQVNPAVAASPSLVRDGTQAVAASPTGAAAFTPNPAGGPAGFDTLLNRILTYGLGAQAQAGVAQPAPQTSGLGPAGNLSIGFAVPGDLAGFAATLQGAQSQASADVSQSAASETAVQTALNTRMSATSGVSMDTEMAHMIQLQNLYTANARLIGAVQSMWTETLQLVQ
jgi:flagellar hook-associated protein 1 FlgK